MMSDRRKVQRRVLAIDPTHWGFGFVVYEGRYWLIDWGLATVSGAKHVGCVRRIAALIERYQPAVVVVEDPRRIVSRRCARVRKLLRAVEQLAIRRNVQPRRVTRGAVRTAFAGAEARTKEQIAGTIAGRYPELLPRLPPPRKLWMP